MITTLNLVGFNWAVRVIEEGNSNSCYELPAGKMPAPAASMVIVSGNPNFFMYQFDNNEPPILFDNPNHRTVENAMKILRDFKDKLKECQRLAWDKILNDDE